jgi:hypothetical protein
MRWSVGEAYLLESELILLGVRVMPLYGVIARSTMPQRAMEDVRVSLFTQARRETVR